MRKKKNRFKNPVQLAFGLILFFISIQIQAQSLSVITFKDQVLVKGVYVQLKQIADIEGHDPNLLQKLKNLVLRKVPLFGTTEQYTKSDVLHYLIKNKIDSKQITFKGPSKVLVSQSSRIISTEMILQECIKYLTRIQPSKEQEVIIEPRGIIKPVSFPDEEGEIFFQFSLKSNENLIGSVSLNLYIIQNGKFQKSLSLTFNLKILKWVWVAREEISKGKILQAQDIVLAQHNITRLGNTRFLKDQEIIGKKASQNIKEGMLIMDKMLTTPLLIRKGQMIQMKVENGPLKITSIGKSQEDGSLGQMIQAKNQDSGKIVSGEVIDPQTIKVYVQ